MDPPLYTNAFLLRFSSRHHGPDEVCLEPQYLQSDEQTRQYGTFLMAPQVAAALALGLIRMLHHEYGEWDSVLATDEHPTAPRMTELPVRQNRPVSGSKYMSASVADKHRDWIERRLAEGANHTTIAAECGIGRTTLVERLKQWRAEAQ